MAGAINQCGLVQLARNAHEELPQQEDVESTTTEERRDRQRIERIHPVQVLVQHIGGDHGDDSGQHHGRQQQDKKPVASPKSKPGKRISH